MKKYAPIILAGAILAYFLFKKKAGLQPQLQTANTADNAKRPPAAKVPSASSGLLSSLIGAGGNLLSRVLPSLLGGNRGGGSGSGGGSPSGASTRIPTSRQTSSPESDITIRKPNSGGFNPPAMGGYGSKTPEDEAWNPAPAGIGSNIPYQTTNSALGTPSYGDGANYPGAGTPEYADPSVTGGAGVWNDPYFGFETDGSSSFQGFQPSAPFNTGEFDQSLLDANLASVGGNPIAEIPGYYDPTLHDPFSGTSDFVQAGGYDPYANDPYIDPFSDFQFTDPFANFYDFNNFDFPSGTSDYPSFDSSSYDSGGGEEKRAGVPTGGGGSGGGSGRNVTVPAGTTVPGTSIPISNIQYWPAMGFT